MTVVLDASMVIKWFRQEADTDAAVAVQHAVTGGVLFVRVPNLIQYEIANVLVWKGQTGFSAVG